MPQQEQWQLSGNAAELYERYVVPYLRLLPIGVLDIPDVIR